MKTMVRTKNPRTPAPVPAADERMHALIENVGVMAKAVQRQVQLAVRALLERNEALAGAISLAEPRVNALEVLIDDQAVRAIAGQRLGVQETRLVLASVKINNDLERIGDLALHIAHRVAGLMQGRELQPPQPLVEMAEAVKEMLNRCLQSLVARDSALAQQVLESDDEIDHLRDRIYELMLRGMAERPGVVTDNFQYMLVARYLERIADHATNIAEDVIFWVQGVDVRSRGNRENIRLQGDDED